MKYLTFSLHRKSVGTRTSLLMKVLLITFGLTLPFLLLEFALRTTFTPDISTSLDNTAFAIHVPPEMMRAFTWDGDGNSLAHIRSENRVLAYELRPSTVLNDSIRINSHGFRDCEYEEKKEPSAYRICVLGDSITFGWWERLEETYPKVLERLLRAHVDPGIEVLNMGVGGYNAEQEAELFHTRVIGFQPDMLIVGFCINDYQCGCDGGLWRHFTRSGSLAWDWLSLRIIQARFLFGRESPIERAYSRIAEEASSLGIPVVVVFSIQISTPTKLTPIYNGMFAFANH